MFANGWASEKWRLACVLLLACAIGLISGYWAISFLLCISLYLAWHLAQLRRVEAWLHSKTGEDSAPVAFGLWNDLINHIFRLHKLHQRTRQRQEQLIQRFEETAQATPDATIITGPHGEIRWANAAAERFMGIRNPGDLGVRLANLVRNPKFNAFIQDCDTDSSFNMLSPTQEDRHLNIRVAPYRDGERLITARDISDLILADEMRRDFVSNASHELKTPLTVMTGYMELLEDEPSINAELKPLVKAVSEQTIRMRSLVDDLLTLSRLDSGNTQQRETVMVAAMLGSIVEDALHLSEQSHPDNIHQIELQADAEKQIEGVYQDVFSAFSNLIFNAVAHTPGGALINISWQQENEFAVLRVKDSGTGIPAHHLSRLTERFYRVQPGRERSQDNAISGKGTGLGLAIVKHIMQSHDGHLEIASQVGKGSEFSCFFPLKS